MAEPTPQSNPIQDSPAILEVDDQQPDEAYATDSDAESAFTASVTSSIRAYRQENGRTYHAYKEGSYLIPNDELENDRLDFQHAVFLRTLGGKLHVAPIPGDVQNVLDIGTGTGIWAIDFADEYPSARVIGTDLSPIQPGLVPPNLHFYIEDAESDWTYNHKFDYIHGRMMAGSFKDYARFFEQCFDSIKPGGYLEMQDVNYALKTDDGCGEKSSVMKWSQLLVEAYGKLERPAEIASRYKTLMEEAGFVDVVEILYKWPINNWPKDPEYKEIGSWTYANVLQGMQGFTMAPFTRALGWSREDVEVFLMDVRKELKSTKNHIYWPIHIVYGRKLEN